MFNAFQEHTHVVTQRGFHYGMRIAVTLPDRGRSLMDACERAAVYITVQTKLIAIECVCDSQRPPSVVQIYKAVYANSASFIKLTIHASSRFP